MTALIVFGGTIDWLPDAEVPAVPALVIVPAVALILVVLGGVVLDIDERTLATRSPDPVVMAAGLITGRSDDKTPNVKVLWPVHTGVAKLKVSLSEF